MLALLFSAGTPPPDGEDDVIKPCVLSAHGLAHTLPVRGTHGDVLGQGIPLQPSGAPCWPVRLQAFALVPCRSVGTCRPWGRPWAQQTVTQTTQGQTPESVCPSYCAESCCLERWFGRERGPLQVGGGLWLGRQPIGHPSGSQGFLCYYFLFQGP